MYMCVPILKRVLFSLNHPWLFHLFLHACVISLEYTIMFLQFIRTLINTMYIRESITLFRAITMFYGTDNIM